MKTKLALFFSLVALTAWAQTNEIRYPELVTKMRTFTNAHVGTVTAAWVTILDDSGGARVAITNLPDWLQKQLGYSPEKAVAQMKSESERRHRELAAKIEQEKFLASMATNATSIHVSALLDDYGLCEIESTHGIQRVYMVGLPARVSGYYQQHASP
jgi:hypothetical protein